jgi:hypothetical protein
VYTSYAVTCCCARNVFNAQRVRRQNNSVRISRRRRLRSVLFADRPLGDFGHFSSPFSLLLLLCRHYLYIKIIIYTSRAHVNTAFMTINQTVFLAISPPATHRPAQTMFHCPPRNKQFYEWYTTVPKYDNALCNILPLNHVVGLVIFFSPYSIIKLSSRCR